VGVEPAIEAHAFGELLDATVGRPIKNSAPGLVCQRKSQLGMQLAVK
jgi:hypothetical protein